MSLLTFLYAIGIALLITLFFAYVLKVRGPWDSFWSFFIIILLSVFAANFWVIPMGPYYYNIHWVPPLAMGIFIALLLAAATPGSTSRSEPNHENENPLSLRAKAFTFGNFFWLLLVFMLIMLGLGIFKVSV